MFLASLAACVQKGSDICAQPSSVSQDHFSLILGSIVTVLVATITTFGALYAKTARVEKRASEAREAVTNNHQTHIRDDLDKLRDQVTERFDNAEKRELVRDRRMETIVQALVSLGATMNAPAEHTQGGTPIVSGELED